MNAKKWIQHFEENRHLWTEPDWTSDRVLDVPEQVVLLRESLATFQLGESGGGTRLRNFLKQSYSEDSDYLCAVGLFVAEEQFHAAILARAVGYLGGELKEKHWMNSIFRKVRAMLGLEFNLQILLTAELIAESYYGLLAKHVQDPVIRSMCLKIVKDEVKHIEFHEEFFRLSQRRWLPVSTALWSLQFQLIFMAVEWFVWADHGQCLASFGITREMFRGRAQSICRRFLGKVVAAPVAPLKDESGVDLVDSKI